MDHDHGATSTTPRYSNIDGFLMPYGFPIEGFKSGLSYTATENDLFVTTYPKCGTTWTQNIVYLICHHGTPLDQKLTQVFPHLEEVGKSVVESLPLTSGFRTIKTHLPFNLTPWNNAAKYIYVARDPKDVVVSFFHHTRGFIKHYDFENGDFNDYFECFINGKVDFGDYFENLRSWLDAAANRDNILVLTYEDLKADPAAGILKIASFMGPSFLSRCTENDNAVLKKVLEHSSLSAMSVKQDRWSSTRPTNQTPFIRKGIVGDYKSLLTPEQVSRLNEKLCAKFSKSEREGLWGTVTGQFP